MTHHTTLGQGFPGGSVSHRVQPQPSQGDSISGDAETRGSDAEDREVTTVTQDQDTRTRQPSVLTNIVLCVVFYDLSFNLVTEYTDTQHTGDSFCGSVEQTMDL